MNGVQSGFRPGQIWLDTDGVPINAHGGGILRHEGTCYWFGEHKIAGVAGNRAHVGVRVYASPDLQRWENRGVALAVASDPASEIASGCIIERPKVLYNVATRRFVMWFHLEPRGPGYAAARSGVAVAERPEGPYHYRGSLRPNAGVWPADTPPEERRLLSAAEEEALRARTFHGGPVTDFPERLLWRRDFAGGQMARDMTLFLDDDGTAWHVYASEENGTLHVSRLTDDYLAPAGDYVRVLPGQFREAPAVLKRDRKYYLFTSGCTGWRPNALRVAVANSLRGPWKDLGNPCEGSEEERNTTFWAQPAFILPPHTTGTDACIFMADRWQPENAIDARHVWLPLCFHGELPIITWQPDWDLGVFQQRSASA